MMKFLAMVALFSLSAGLPQDQSESKEKYLHIATFVQTPPDATQPNPQKTEENQRILELLKKYNAVLDATGNMLVTPMQDINERLVDAQILKEYPIHVNEADASKFRIRTVPEPRGFRSNMPVNKPDVKIDPKIIIEMQKK
jgi:hypothetical protein